MIRFKITGRGEAQVVEVVGEGGRPIARIMSSQHEITVSSEKFTGIGTEAGPFTQSVNFNHGRRKPKKPPFVTIKFEGE